MSNRIQISNPEFDNADQRHTDNEVRVDIGNDSSDKKKKKEGWTGNK